jgi:uncharacterized protein YndB with AHSA1/START domain
MSSETRMEDAIVTECDLDDHPSKVWRALTEPELTAAWLVPEDVDCQIIEADPERLLRCSWRSRSDERDCHFRAEPGGRRWHASAHRA